MSTERHGRQPTRQLQVSPIEELAEPQHRRDFGLRVEDADFHNDSAEQLGDDSTVGDQTHGSTGSGVVFLVMINAQGVEDRRS